MKSDKQLEFPLLTIVTICKNSLHELERTTHSIRNQTFKSFKHIVIDGNSSDGTKAWLDYHKDIVSISEPDRGIYDAMNKGIIISGKVNSKWTIFMNSGDLFDSVNTLELIATLLENEKNANFIFGAVRYNKIHDGSVIQKIHAARVGLGIEMPCSHQSCFVRTDLLNANLFNTSYKITADFEFWCRACVNGFGNTIITSIIVSEIEPGGVSQTREDLLQEEYFDILSKYRSSILAISWLILRKFKKIIGR